MKIGKKSVKPEKQVSAMIQLQVTLFPTNKVWSISNTSVRYVRIHDDEVAEDKDIGSTWIYYLKRYVKIQLE